VHGTIYEFEQLPRVVHSPVAARAHSRRAVSRPAGSAPLVGIVRNPGSHRNRGYEAELVDQPNILTATPQTRGELQSVLTRFAERGIDYLAIDGGDGTIRDVLTCGAGIFGNIWPRLIILPKGKTNALAVDLGVPEQWPLTEALAAARNGRTVERRPLAVAAPDDDAVREVHGFVLGAGVFTKATQAGQQAHRWGAFNGLAVALTIAWLLLKTVFGRGHSDWREGTRMILRRGRCGPELAHSGHGGRNQRFFLLASTLQRFPLGLRPFGQPRPGLKLALIDSPLRRVMALIPPILVGFGRRRAEALGIHRVDGDEFEVDLGDRFILDGESFPAGRYLLRQGPRLRFVVP
jgi:diacylglycerol kinase (ATP)